MQKKTRANVQEADEPFDESLTLLLDTMTESIREEYQNEREPYERYIARLKMRFYEDKKTFSQRFKKGYRALQDELKSKES